MKVNVFLELGDSNSVGFGMSAATLPATLAGHDYGATFIFGPGATWWAAYAPGVNSGTANNPGAWGPDAQFLRRVHDADPDAINLIVSVQRGQTPLGQDAAALDWAPGSPGEMFAQAASTIAAARSAFFAANGYAMPPFSAVLWIGGPNDAVSAAKAAAYQANLADLFGDLRDLIGQPDAEILFSRMTDSESALPYNRDVRVAQWAVDQIDPHATSFKTIGYDLQPDAIHYSASGLVQLGDGFFEAWATL